MSFAPSRPAQALRIGAVMLAVVVALRVPAMKARFAAAVGAGRGTDVAALTGSSVRSHDAIRPPPLADPRPRQAGMPGPQLVLGAPPVAPRGGLVVRIRTVADTAESPRAAGPLPAAAGPVAVITPSTSMAAAPAAAAATPAASITGGVMLPSSDPGALATTAYTRLAAGDRRGAVRLFDAALLSDDPRGAAWRRQRDALTRRWSGSAYSIVRSSGPAGLATEPVLGGGQSGGAVAFTPDPLSPRPVALTLRGSGSHDDAGRSAFAAVGVEWRPLAGVTLAAERRLAVGPAARGDWTLRLAAGIDRTRGRLRLTGYGEGGIVGRATYAAVQGRVAGTVPVGHFSLEPGIGGWASLQHDRANIDRVDLGPGIIARAGPLTVEVDYRVRVAGNAAPGSGPVLTLSAAF